MRVLIAAAFLLAAGPAWSAEDCVGFAPESVTAGNAGGTWKLAQGTKVLLDFGADSAGASRALAAIRHYHFTAQCFVRRPNPAMMYWRNGVAIPPGNMPEQDCIALEPTKVRALFVGDGWKVADDRRWLIDYGSNREAANQATAVIKAYTLNRECFITRPHVVMQYWLAE